MSNQKWETRPLEIWARAKELRANWQKSVDESASAETLILADGNTGDLDWSVGFCGVNVIEDNPLGAMLASKSDSFARKCRLASEVRGWGRELCGYVNNCWGSQFLGYQIDNSEFPYRDMSIPFPDPCDQHTKRGQQCMDLSPIPRWGGDWPMYLGEDDPLRDEALIDHKVYYMVNTIKQIEKSFGKEFDPQVIIDNIGIRPQLEEYGLRVSQLMTNIPTPISVKDLYSFYTMGTLTKVDPQETLDFWKSFVDELQWRVDNNIAAVGNERYRWMEAHPPAWHYLKYYRYMEQYGAVCVGSQYSHLMAGPVELKEDGTLGHRNIRPAPKDVKLRTIEDAIRFISTEARGHRFKDDEYFRYDAITDFAKAYHVDGAIMPLNRSGVGCTLTRKEQALRLNAIGVNTMHYENSQPGDRTDMDEHHFFDQLDSWMECQGFSKLVD